MKQILSSCLLTAMGLLAVSCGNQGNKNAEGISQESAEAIAEEIVGDLPEGSTVGYTGDAATDLKNLDETNYVEITKGIFGVDITPQAGWEVYQAKSPNKVNNVDVIFTNAGEVDEDAIISDIFTKCQAVAKDGLYKVDMDWNTGKMSRGEKLADYAALKATGSGMWFYDYNDMAVLCSPSARSKATKSFIEYSFTLTKTN